MPSLARTRMDITSVYNRHVDTVYRLCYSFMKNRADAEDMVQETFLRLLAADKVFENEKHEKAWLIVTAFNLCKDSLKKWWRRHEDIADCLELAQESGEKNGELLQALFALPKDYKTVVYMYYYEGYTTGEIARYLHCPEATICSRLSRARDRLRTILGGETR